MHEVEMVLNGRMSTIRVDGVEMDRVVAIDVQVNANDRTRLFVELMPDTIQIAGTAEVVELHRCTRCDYVHERVTGAE